MSNCPFLAAGEGMNYTVSPARCSARVEPELARPLGIPPVNVRRVCRRLIAEAMPTEVKLNGRRVPGDWVLVMVVGCDPHWVDGWGVHHYPMVGDHIEVINHVVPMATLRVV